MARLGLAVAEEAERMVAGDGPAYAVDSAALAREACSIPAIPPA